MIPWDLLPTVSEHGCQRLANVNNRKAIDEFRRTLRGF